MKSSGRVPSSSLAKQRGFVFKLIHSLLIVAVVVGLVVMYKAGKLPFINYRPNIQLPNWNTGNYSNNDIEDSGSNNDESLWESGNNYVKATQWRKKSVPVTREHEDTTYTDGRYAVQLASGYDSRQLYAWRDSLVREGVNAYLVSLNTTRGLLFKLRVGAYTKRADAEQMRDKLANRYPDQGLFADSFVVQGD